MQMFIFHYFLDCQRCRTKRHEKFSNSSFKIAIMLNFWFLSSLLVQISGVHENTVFIKGFCLFLCLTPFSDCQNNTGTRAFVTSCFKQNSVGIDINQ